MLPAHIVIFLIELKLFGQLTLFLHLHPNLLLLDLCGQLSRYDFFVVVSAHMITLDSMSDEHIIPLLVCPIQLFKLLVALNLRLRMVHLLTILIVLIGDFVLSIDALLESLKVSVLVTHERRHASLDLLQGLLSILKIEDLLLRIAVLEEPVGSAAFVPHMLNHTLLFVVTVCSDCMGGQTRILTQGGSWCTRTTSSFIRCILSCS